MKRIAVQLTFTSDDGAFEDLEASDIHGALCRGYPYLRMSELDVQQLEESDPRKTFRDALASLQNTYRATPGAVRAELMVIAALALQDAHAVNRGAGAGAAATTEEQFVATCRGIFRRMRSLGLPGGVN